MLFDVRRAQLFCDDGTQPRQTLEPVRIPLKADRSFAYRAYEPGAELGLSRELYWVTGQLLADGRAKGFVVKFIDPFDPPDTANLAECGTFDFAHWRAERVGPFSSTRRSR